MSNYILVVDDSRTVRASLQYVLQKNGYRVVAAENGLHGLRQLEKMGEEGAAPAMIITDLNMPSMDGLAFIKKVREQPCFQALPILVLTTEHCAERKLEGKGAGASGWLVKPFKPEQLVSVVKKFVQ